MSTLAVIKDLQQRMSASIIGQEDVVKNLVMGLLANGNILMEGLPGLAKTRAVKGLARNLEADLRRIQLTPDLLPSDVTGREIYHEFEKVFRRSTAVRRREPARVLSSPDGVPSQIGRASCRERV